MWNVVHEFWTWDEKEFKIHYYYDYPIPRSDRKLNSQVLRGTIKRTLSSEREQESEPARLSQERRKHMQATKINSKLLLLLAERHISDTALAEMTGLNRVTIYRLKKGKGIPEYPTLVKIAEALGVEVKDII